MIYTPTKQVPVALSRDEIDVLIMSLVLAEKVLNGESHKVVLKGLKERLGQAKE